MQLATDLATTTLRKEQKSSFVQEAYSNAQNSLNDEEILDTLRGLEVDETRLAEQKDNLSTLLNQLKSKAKDEVEKRRRKIEKLNSEVSDLKLKCEKFANWINTESLGV